jgi:hypothetical protein
MNTQDSQIPEDGRETLRVLSKRHFDPLSGGPMEELPQERPSGDTWMPAPLPPFNEAGFLPEGVHEATLDAVKSVLVTSVKRAKMWGQLIEFLSWPISTGSFSHAYIGGGFISQKLEPQDIDLILHVRYPFSDKAFMAMEPFFAVGLDTILESYSVHLHFWVDGFPGDCDFRSFFQYVHQHEARRLGLSAGARKGLIKLELLVDSILGNSEAVAGSFDQSRLVI